MQIAMLYSQLEDSERRSESIIREKDYLLEETTNKNKKILEIYHRGYPEENLTTAYSMNQPILVKLVRDIEGDKNLLVREESEHILDAYRQTENRLIEV